jgi:DNA-binding response OmpR family regulator
VSTPRIFIVEDNPADVLLVREALNNRGVTFSLEHHSNGEDAAKAIAAMMDAPKLFVLDLNVPRVHGFELLRIIRACPAVSHVPVAILTSSQAPTDRARSEQYGADAYIVKPQGYDEFVTLVGAAIGRFLTNKARGSCSSSSHRFRPWRQTRSTHSSNPGSVRRSHGPVRSSRT